MTFLKNWLLRYGYEGDDWDNWNSEYNEVDYEAVSTCFTCESFNGNNPTCERAGDLRIYYSNNVITMFSNKL